MAVKRASPADYRRVKEIWEDILEMQPKPTATGSQITDSHQHSGAAGKIGSGRGRPSGSTRGGRSNQVTARVGGVFVCHAFNELAGCKRDKHGQGCKNATGQPFAHCCNFKKADGDFCLASHTKFNHK